jgi:hypothetical protein
VPDVCHATDPANLGGLTVQVASVDDLTRMKRAAARPRDLIELEILGALGDELESAARA